MRVRSDCGTENVVLSAMQCYLRADGIDQWAGDKAHVYGSSPANQRIEAWWSFLRRSRSSWWIDLFQDMSQSGVLEMGNTYHMEALWYCYHKLLEEDLYRVKEHWNSHYIRKSQHETIRGIPDILFFLPEYYGGENCLMKVSDARLNEMEQNISETVNDNIYKEYFDYVIDAKSWFYPDNNAGAFDLYENLINLPQ